MKQARPVGLSSAGKIRRGRGVGLGAALLVALAFVSSTAWAQKKPAGKKPPTAPAPAGGASTEIDLDEKPAGGATTPAPAGGAVELDAPGPAQPTTPTGPVGEGGICEIDPSACPKQSDIKAAQTKQVAAEIYAVQQIYALRYHRFELNPYWGFTLNDQFVSHPGPGLAINWYISNVLAIGVNGNFYAGLNSDSDFNFQNRRAARIGVPLTEYRESVALNFTYVPMYGKFAGFGDFIFHYDAYIVGGVGEISTRPIAVVDPDNRAFEYRPKLAFNAGIGLRVFFNRWLAATMEVRDYIYNEELESLSIGRTQAEQQDANTWYGENRITNHVQAQVGLSVFIPFSWDYRLPK